MIEALRAADATDTAFVAALSELFCDALLAFGDAAGADRRGTRIFEGLYVRRKGLNPQTKARLVRKLAAAGREALARLEAASAFTESGMPLLYRRGLDFNVARVAARLEGKKLTGIAWRRTFEPVTPDDGGMLHSFLDDFKEHLGMFSPALADTSGGGLLGQVESLHLSIAPNQQAFAEARTTPEGTVRIALSLAWYDLALELSDRTSPFPRPCRQCGTAFHGRRTSKAFCSDKCRTAWNNARKAKDGVTGLDGRSRVSRAAYEKARRARIARERQKAAPKT